MKEIRIDKIVDRLVTLIICCNLSPEEMRERKAEVVALLPPTGLANGWDIVLENNTIFESDNFGPEPCDTIEGNWHYVAIC